MPLHAAPLQVGVAAFDSWKAAHPADFSHTMSKFEFARCTYTGEEADTADFDDDDDLVNCVKHRIPIRPSLKSRIAPEDLQVLAVEHGGRDSITLSPRVMRQLFDPVVQNVVSLVVKELDELDAKGTPASKVLASGGFMNSLYLQRRLRLALASRAGSEPAIPMFVPQHPDTAVMEGTCSLGPEWVVLIDVPPCHSGVQSICTGFTQPSHSGKSMSALSGSCLHVGSTSFMSWESRPASGVSVVFIDRTRGTTLDTDRCAEIETVTCQAVLAEFSKLSGCWPRTVTHIVHASTLACAIVCLLRDGSNINKDIGLLPVGCKVQVTSRT